MKGLRVAQRVGAQVLKAQNTARLSISRPAALSRTISTARTLRSAGQAQHHEEVIFEDDMAAAMAGQYAASGSLPSPPVSAARESAKLAALHARLQLPSKLPLETLARTLVDVSADPNPDFNNEQLAQIGASLLSLHVSEWLMATYPRLPMAVFYASMNAYIGKQTLLQMAREWGVDSAAVPGCEVDAGLLQFSKLKSGATLPQGTSVRPNDQWNYRRGMSSRVVYDDEFGDVITRNMATETQTAEAAHSQFVRAVIGAIYLHAGREEAKRFIKSHVLSRHLDISKLFVFETATRDLSRLCAREDFDYPVARLLSETGRGSRHPVYVVGIYSGKDKLGEAAGASLNEARTRAAIAALKSWYMYNPNPGKGVNVAVPSDAESGKAWEPVHVDLGEIVAC